MTTQEMIELLEWLGEHSRDLRNEAYIDIAARLKALEDAIIGAPCEEDGMCAHCLNCDCWKAAILDTVREVE